MFPSAACTDRKVCSHSPTACNDMSPSGKRRHHIELHLWSEFWFQEDSCMDTQDKLVNPPSQYHKETPQLGHSSATCPPARQTPDCVFVYVRQKDKRCAGLFTDGGDRCWGQEVPCGLGVWSGGKTPVPTEYQRV